MDIKGFDGSAKVAALLNVLMNANITPKQIECQGIEHITPADIQEAKQKGMRIKVLCEGYFDAQGNPVGSLFFSLTRKKLLFHPFHSKIHSKKEKLDLL